MRVISFDMGKRNFAFAEVEISENCTQKGNVIFFNVHDFGTCISPLQLFRDLIPHLDSFKKIWERAEIILIEQQLSSLNIQASRLACHVAAYFFHKYPHLPVFDYPNSYKTKLLGEIQKTNHRERKQFAIRKVSEWFEESDPVVWDWIQTLPKKDDVADCILMCITFPMSPFYKKVR